LPNVKSFSANDPTNNLSPLLFGSLFKCSFWGDILSSSSFIESKDAFDSFLVGGFLWANKFNSSLLN
jgi:hypothetical protein